MSEEKKDIIVVAAPGHSVILNVGNHIFEITGYAPLNLSKLFSPEVIEKCAALYAQLEDGNLVYYKGQPLPEDKSSPKIPKMNSVGESSLEMAYDQTNEVKMVKPKLPKKPKVSTDIQKRVNANKDKILARDAKILDKRTEDKVVTSTTNNSVREKALSKDELTMEIQMDVSSEEFQKRQIASRKKLLDQDKADNNRIIADIAKIDQKEKDEQAQLSKLNNASPDQE